ncbi:MAG: hypothetical protein IJS47_03350 [Clostridia bacterium]|nr:hypothetical protein [Clostridia bacterium]
MKRRLLIAMIAVLLCVGCDNNNEPIETPVSTPPVEEQPVEEQPVEEQPVEEQLLETSDGPKTQEERAKILEQIAEVPENNEAKNGVLELKFRSTLSLDYLKSISGQKVKMTGYISTLSPINGEFAYLMNLPYQSCPYCVPGTTEIYNTMAIIAKKNKRIDFTDSPVTAEGILKTGSFTDDFGYSYNVRIEDVVVKEADASALSKNALRYNALTQEKIIDEINNIFMSLDEIIFYDYYEAQYGTDINSIQSFDMGRIATVIDKINAISKTDYTDIIEILQTAKRLAETANKNLAAGSIEDNKKIQNSLEQVFMSFGNWVTQYEL